MSFQTEYAFTLPKGYVDQNGNVHKDGIMRLATAADEILPLKDPRVQQNPGYLPIILLSRVVTKLGTLSAITPAVIENIFATDLAYLQNLYATVNTFGPDGIAVVCPSCGHGFHLEAPCE